MKANKLAIISDINGNMYALNSFLDYVNADPQIEYVINLGNFIGYGGFSKEIFDLITTDQRFINIIGPNEYRIMNPKDDKDSMSIREEFGEPRIQQLKNIPGVMEIQLYDKKFLMMHSNRYLDSYSLEKRLKFLFMDEYKDTHYAQQHFVYDYILYGCSGISEVSTYIEQPFKRKAEVIISPGDLYMHFYNTICFCLMEFNGSKVDITIKNEKTNTNKMVEKIISMNRDHISVLSNYGYFNVDGDKGTLIIELLHDETMFSQYYKHFWEQSIEFILKEAEYVGFDIPKKDEKIAKELKESLLVYSEHNRNREFCQIEGKINDAVKKLLSKNYLDQDQSFKWSEIWLLDKNKNLLFSFLKYDGKCQFCDLDEEKMAYMKSIVAKSDQLIYRVYE
ncbi:metallophosphoesterase family protein [Defluviitalea raffinosedens]|uniref:metallophosphoesterase family protein n=1 Tax=Defluviitalea raffinosedens TaxID=1450156 RepID=UPI001957A6FD|nr:metallophosphoesterase family protein [Defluviitalea raffinosedens]MBM7685472.1 hypothetical protein [Defluviitalea raffinosedens]